MGNVSVQIRQHQNIMSRPFSFPDLVGVSLFAYWPFPTGVGWAIRAWRKPNPTLRGQQTREKIACSRPQASAHVFLAEAGANRHLKPNKQSTKGSRLKAHPRTAAS